MVAALTTAGPTKDCCEFPAAVSKTAFYAALAFLLDYQAVGKLGTAYISRIFHPGDWRSVHLSTLISPAAPRLLNRDGAGAGVGSGRQGLDLFGLSRGQNAL